MLANDTLRIEDWDVLSVQCAVEMGRDRGPLADECIDLAEAGTRETEPNSGEYLRQGARRKCAAAGWMGRASQGGASHR